MKVRVVGCLEVVDQKGRCHRGPVGIGLWRELGQFCQDVVGIDAGRSARGAQPLLPATAIVELVAFENTRRGGLCSDDLRECWIIGHGGSLSSEDVDADCGDRNDSQAETHLSQPEHLGRRHRSTSPHSLGHDDRGHC